MIRLSVCGMSEISRNQFSRYSSPNQSPRYHGAPLSKDKILKILIVRFITFLNFSLSFLGVLCKESNILSLYDIQNANGGSTEEMEPTPLERGLTLTDSSEHISSFVWYPNEENRLIYSTSALNIKVSSSVFIFHKKSKRFF